MCKKGKAQVRTCQRTIAKTCARMGNQSAARNVAEYTVRSRQYVELSQGLEVKSNNWLRAYGDGS